MTSRSWNVTKIFNKFELFEVKFRNVPCDNYFILSGEIKILTDFKYYTLSVHMKKEDEFGLIALRKMTFGGFVSFPATY